MHPRILTAAIQPPHYGGAGTFSYLLFAALREAGVEAHHLIAAREQQAPFFRNVFGEDWWNPAGLPGVHLHLLSSYAPDDRQIRELVESIGPDLVVVKQYPLLGMLRGTAPNAPRWWLPSSCQAFAEVWREGRVAGLEDGLERLDELFPHGAAPVADTADDGKELSLADERLGVELADRLICNSEATRRLFAACYPEHAAKLDQPLAPGALAAGWFAAVVEDWVRRRGPAPVPFEDRNIDVLFVASRWDRGEKNPELVADLIDRFAETRDVHVAGHYEPRFAQATVHGLVPHARVLELMADARVVVAASALDSAPGVLYEAILMGCNAVASRNCGNWEACDPDLIVDRYDVDGFADKINLALARPPSGGLPELPGSCPPDRVAADLLGGLRRPDEVT